jgi:hypothetical protein
MCAEPAWMQHADAFDCKQLVVATPCGDRGMLEALVLLRRSGFSKLCTKEHAAVTSC